MRAGDKGNEELQHIKKLNECFECHNNMQAIKIMTKSEPAIYECHNLNKVMDYYNQLQVLDLERPIDIACLVFVGIDKVLMHQCPIVSDTL